MTIATKIPIPPRDMAAGPVSRSGPQAHDVRKVVVKLKRNQEAVGRFRSAADNPNESLFARLVEDGHARHVSPVFPVARGASRAPAAVIRDVAEKLRSSADRVGPGLSHPNDQYGWGRLNIAAALI